MLGTYSSLIISVVLLGTSIPVTAGTTTSTTPSLPSTIMPKADDDFTNKPDPRMAHIKLAYQKNLQKWKQQGLTSYRYTLQHSCFCLPTLTTPINITVVNKIVTSASTENLRTNIRPDGTESPVTLISAIDRALTIEQLFARVKSAIDSGAAQIDIKYDPKLGYPTSIYIDQSTLLADDEIALRSSGLTRGNVPTSSGSTGTGTSSPTTPKPKTLITP